GVDVTLCDGGKSNGQIRLPYRWSSCATPRLPIMEAAATVSSQTRSARHEIRQRPSNFREGPSEAQLRTRPAREGVGGIEDSRKGYPASTGQSPGGALCLTPSRSPLHSRWATKWKLRSYRPSTSC